MPPPRRLIAPTAPAAPPTPARPQLRQFRSGSSAQLDSARVRPRGQREEIIVGDVAPYVRWPEFMRYMYANWEAGEHLSFVGQTGSGKTTAMIELLAVRDFVVVIQNKRRDESMQPLLDRGYVVTNEFDPREWNVDDRPRVIFHCPLSSASLEAENRQREQIRAVLRGVYIVGGWCVALDEVGYLSRDLKLDREMNAIWREGRSAGTTMVAGTQRPVNVPRNMWEQATHNIDWKVTGVEDRKTASDYLGALSAPAFEIMATLPQYEFLYVNSVESVAMRSKVEL